jgi:hypothetical protein
MEPEVMDPSLLAYGITMAREFDYMFGKNVTLTMSQRDVPGMTRAVSMRHIPTHEATHILLTLFSQYRSSYPPRGRH